MFLLLFPAENHKNIVIFTAYFCINSINPVATVFRLAYNGAMADMFDPRKRSEVMGRIRGKDTKPELLIRKGLHRMGYRYRLHVKNLPGKPDMVFKRYNAVVFVNGCFWHLHECNEFKWPKSRVEFWKQKLNRNRERDLQEISELLDAGWRVLVIWGCSLRGRFRIGLDAVLRQADEWLKSESRFAVIEGRDPDGIVELYDLF